MKIILIQINILIFVSITTAHAATIQLPATGQTKCYDPTGNTTNEIPCTGTGQDGDKMMGVTWDEATRFTNNANGTITDTLTGLIWLQNANCTETVGGIAKASGSLTWPNALTWSNNLASGKCGLTDGSSVGQWRLPSLNELESLINRKQASSLWLGTKGFSNVQDTGYLSSSSAVFDIRYVWAAGMDGIITNNGNKNLNGSVWPVRGGQ